MVGGALNFILYYSRGVNEWVYCRDVRVYKAYFVVSGILDRGGVLLPVTSCNRRTAASLAHSGVRGREWNRGRVRPWRGYRRRSSCRIDSFRGSQFCFVRGWLRSVGSIRKNGWATYSLVVCWCKFKACLIVFQRSVWIAIYGCFSLLPSFDAIAWILQSSFMHQLLRNANGLVPAELHLLLAQLQNKQRHM